MGARHWAREALLMSDKTKAEVRAQNPFVCSDGACVLLIPGVYRGMHTNAGCRCLAECRDPNERARVRNGIRWLAEVAGGDPGSLRPVLDRVAFLEERLLEIRALT